MDDMPDFKRPTVSDADLDRLFRTARSYNGWKDTVVSDIEMMAIYDLMKFGPTSANIQPLRIQFVKSEENKQRLKPYIDEGNVEKCMSAPVIAILGTDMEFYEHMEQVFPHYPQAREWFADKPDVIAEHGLRNSSLQCAYLILAARSIGLDCGPMSGFKKEGVDQEFWQGTKVKTNMLCNIGHGDETSIQERLPRYKFNEACQII